MRELEHYEVDADLEHAGLRGVVGKILAFLGFVVFANFTIVTLLFRHILSFQNELLFAALGGAVGVIGLLLRGTTRLYVALAVGTVIAGIVAVTFVHFLSNTFGLIGLVAVVLAFFWWESRFGGRVRD